MNLPNKITTLRVCLIPVFLYFYLSPAWNDSTGQFIAAAIFGLASATDALDGYIARRQKLVTNFGKLMDPLADKLLVSAAMIAMTVMGDLPAWAVIVLISREFFISGFRQLALEQNLVLAASFWAKVKTVVQVAMIMFILVAPLLVSIETQPSRDVIDTVVIQSGSSATLLTKNILVDVITHFLIFASIILSVFSAAEYALKNKQVFK